jgi:hypothetical protein
VVERRRELEAVAGALTTAGVTTWIGGGGRATAAIARRTGAVRNLWRASARSIAEAAAEGEVSWAGRLSDDPGAASAGLAELAAAGASWVVTAWAGAVADLAGAASAAGVALG